MASARCIAPPEVGENNEDRNDVSAAEQRLRENNAGWRRVEKRLNLRLPRAGERAPYPAAYSGIEAR